MMNQDRVARCLKWSVTKIATVGDQIRPIKQNVEIQPDFGQLYPVNMWLGIVLSTRITIHLHL